MKKVLILLILFCVLFCFVACEKNHNTSTNTSQNKSIDLQTEEIDMSNSDSDTSTSEITDREETTSPFKKTDEPIYKDNTSNTDNNNNTVSKTSTSNQSNNCKHINSKIVPNDISKIPTCTEPGYYIKWCPDCHKQFEELADALGHTGGTATCVTKAICTRCQKEYGGFNKNNHKALCVGCNNNAYAATCDKAGYTGDKSFCEACNTTVEKGNTISALGHRLSAAVYDKNKDKIKEPCSRQNCKYAKYTDIEPLSIKVTPNELNIYGGVYPYCKCYRISSNGSKECSLQGWPASADVTWHGYYFGIGSIGETIEIQAFDKSGRSLTKKYLVVEGNSFGRKNYQEIS